MIRLTVRELYALQQSIQSSGEVNATVMPFAAFSTSNLFVAWARATDGQTYYLALWKDSESWEKAKSDPSLLVNVFASENEPVEEVSVEQVQEAINQVMGALRDG
jgi:hypothetical protein